MVEGRRPVLVDYWIIVSGDGYARWVRKLNRCGVR